MLKKITTFLSIISILGLNSIPAFSANCLEKTEYIDVHKKAPCNEVIVTNISNTIKQGNVLEFAFDEKFYSKTHEAGELVNFIVPQALYTREGTLLFPKCTKIVAEIINIQKPRMFNKNARVDLIFRRIVLPDNTCYEIKARPFTKDYKLKEGPWTTTGKIFLSTITLGIVGAGAGVGFAFIPNPAKLGAGFAIGIPVGCGVGLALGLITPGCHYKAKKGELVYAIVLEDFCLNNVK